jgi:hypothetical protein
LPIVPQWEQIAPSGHRRPSKWWNAEASSRKYFFAKIDIAECLSSYHFRHYNRRSGFVNSLIVPETA